MPTNETRVAGPIEFIGDTENYDDGNETDAPTYHSNIFEHDDGTTADDNQENEAPVNITQAPTDGEAASDLGDLGDNKSGATRKGWLALPMATMPVFCAILS